MKTHLRVSFLMYFAKTKSEQNTFSDLLVLIHLLLFTSTLLFDRIIDIDN